VQAVSELAVGHPSHTGTQVGPVIDADAHRRLTKAIAEAPAHGTVAHTRTELPDGGWFVGPTVVTDVDPASPLATDELFGPVLAVFCVPDLDAALDLANRTDYALTAGIFSRSPAAIRRAAAELQAGNVYVNRGVTGAVVGRQPFGGYALSGVGSKAGGPDYLLQFIDPRTITENTLRQGFAPEG
jgi:RHH-type proline utilization regulon transcriptional repressor/proline dehydrogenase/delta 1-pyrroline-5-carboxylate dehydrogenase